MIHVLSGTRLVQSELAVSLPSAIHRKEVGGEFAEPPSLHPGRGEHVFLCRREDRLVEHDPVGRRAEKHRVWVERKARLALDCAVATATSHGLLLGRACEGDG